MNVNKLQLILDYKLTPREAKCYKIALIWEATCRYYFPNLKIVSYFKKGDPRKSALFKQCWKLLRETEGLLRFDQFKQYFIANLSNMKAHNPDTVPNLTSMSGNNAWIRWKVWERAYNRKLLEKIGEQEKPLHVEPAIIFKLDLTKKFLFEKCEGQPTLDKLQNFYNEKSLNVWILSGKISHFYLILSPFINKILDLQELEKKLCFDSKIYSDKINENVIEFFQKEFSYEYQ